MLISISLCLICLGDPEPMNVYPGMPVLDIVIEDLEGRSYALDVVVDDSFCFVLSTHCPDCLEAMRTIQTMIAPTYHTLFLFVDPVEAVNRHLGAHPIVSENIDIYTIDFDQLKPYNVKYLPTLFAYKNSHLKVGFYGRLDQKNGRWVVDMFEKRFSKKGNGR